VWTIAELERWSINHYTETGRVTGLTDAQRARYGHRKCRPPLPLQKWINGQNAAEKVFRVLVGRRDAKLYSLQKLSFRRLAA
jgi:hypothetical protein